MGLTLAGIGPRPVVELHAAGLKVGEITLRQHQHTARFLQHPYETLVQPLTSRTSNYSTSLR
jgi:hypothetical protein